MHIELITEGGFAAIPGLSRPIRLDDAGAPDAGMPDAGTPGAGTPDADAQGELRQLVAAALAEHQASVKAAGKGGAAGGSGATGAVPDARHYRLRIEHDGKTDLLKASDPALPPAFKALMQYVRQHGTR